MALKLNIYKTITPSVATSAAVVYTAPTGYTGIVLLANISNPTTGTLKITLEHRRSASDTSIVTDFPISSKDSANLIEGKLFLQSGDQLVLTGEATTLEAVISILETLN